MRKKLFTHGTTFFMTAEMYDKVKRVTDSLEVSLSDFIRGLIEEYLRKNSADATPLHPPFKPNEFHDSKKVNK